MNKTSELMDAIYQNCPSKAERTTEDMVKEWGDLTLDDGMGSVRFLHLTLDTAGYKSLRDNLEHIPMRDRDSFGSYLRLSTDSYKEEDKFLDEMAHKLTTDTEYLPYLFDAEDFSAMKDLISNLEDTDKDAAGNPEVWICHQRKYGPVVVLGLALGMMTMDPVGKNTNTVHLTLARELPEIFSSISEVERFRVYKRIRELDISIKPFLSAFLMLDLDELRTMISEAYPDIADNEFYNYIFLSKAIGGEVTTIMSSETGYRLLIDKSVEHFPALMIYDSVGQNLEPAAISADDCKFIHSDPLLYYSSYTLLETVMEENYYLDEDDQIEKLVTRIYNDISSGHCYEYIHAKVTNLLDPLPDSPVDRAFIWMSLMDAYMTTGIAGLKGRSRKDMIKTTGSLPDCLGYDCFSLLSAIPSIFQSDDDKDTKTDEVKSSAFEERFRHKHEFSDFKHVHSILELPVDLQFQLYEIYKGNPEQAATVLRFMAGALPGCEDELEVLALKIDKLDKRNRFTHRKQN